WLARRRARRIGIPPWHIDWLIPLLLLSSALGTWLAGKFCQFVFGGQANDRVLYGALWMSVAAGAIYGRTTRLPLGRLGDAFALPLPLGISVLRVGCFLAGCCWGDICASPQRLDTIDDPAWRHQVQTIPALCGDDWPLGVTFPAGSPAYYQHLTAGLLPAGAERSLPVHPVQLYEASATLCLFGVLLAFERRLHRWGDAFLLCLLGYSAVRFMIEWFRADNQVMACQLTFSQWASVASACVCLVLWRARAVLARRQAGLCKPP
ncbi:MAG: prolipoprotein diacylglyceryl transferase, partial [Planctomycetes bacterium]|nr:prolipoprotein diacylglyceryl transferase [Planctomycetota bacterium]